MHKLLLSCLKATELMEKKFHFRLTFRERMQLKMHKSMCKACSRYDKQSAILHKALSHPELFNGHIDNLEGFKEEILRKLDESN